MQREVDPSNAIMIYNNGRFPSTHLGGEQSNERQHAVFKDFAIKKGKYGYNFAYIRKTLLSNYYNNTKYKWYKRRQNQELFKQLELSDSLINDIENNIQQDWKLHTISNQIKNHGIYCLVDDVMKKIDAYVSSQIIINQLEFTSEPIWSASYYSVLLKYCVDMELEKWEETIPRFHLERISRRLFKKFTIDFIEKRLNAIGFFFLSA